VSTGKIKLVQGDNRPYIRLTLKQADGTPMDVSSATVVMHFRQAGETAVLSTIVCTKINGGTAGEVSFNFPGNTLDVEPGAYEGEIEIDFDGEKQTVYEPLKFAVRAQFN
jgi:hypothetical protein